MDKKIKITESQFERLKQYLFETPYDHMIKGVQVGDIISIMWKGSKNNFKVVDNTSGHIVMDNIDQGSANINYRYLMLFTSFHGDDLEMRRVHKEKEKENLNDFKQWKPMTVKDITDIQIIRDGKVVDRVDPVSPTAAKQQQNAAKGVQQPTKPDFETEVNNYLAVMIEDLKENNGLRLVFSSGDIFFCCMNKFGSSTESMFVLELNKDKNTTVPSLNAWDSYVLQLKGSPDDDNLYELNKDVVTSTDNGKTFNLKFKVNAGTSTKDVIIYGIDGVGVLPNCEGVEGEDEKEGELAPDEIEYDREAVYNMVLSDKRLRDAFYKQPNFWQHFVAKLKGKKHPGTGFIQILKVLSRYNNKKVSKKIGEGFNYKGQVLFKALEPLELEYSGATSSSNTYKISNLKPSAIDIRRFEMNQIAKVLIKKLNDFNNPTYKLRILVTGPTENPNIKICDIQIVNEKYPNKFDVISELQSQKLEFLESEGYQSQKQPNSK